MSEGDMLFTITVPGSTANLGPGFDSVGMALSRYLKLSVFQSSEWSFEADTEDLSQLPTGTDNLIYQVAKRVADSFGEMLPACRVKVWSDIPLARGMGSSAAAIVAGIELANECLNLQLSDKEKLHFASLEEGHPDNAGASLYGGLVFGLHEKDETHLIQVPEVELDVIVVIPSYEVLTKDARNVLPKEISYKSAVEASAISNLLVAAFLTKDYKLAGRMMTKDLFHQPYRAMLVPELSGVEQTAIQQGAYGVALSGAGPTVLVLTEKGKGQLMKEHLSQSFPNCEVDCVHVPATGSTVCKENVIRPLNSNQSI